MASSSLSQDESELKIAVELLSELRDIRKKTIFMQMLNEIQDLKSQIKCLLKYNEHYKQKIKNLTIENDCLRSCNGTPVNSLVEKPSDDVRIENELMFELEKLKLAKKYIGGGAKPKKIEAANSPETENHVNENSIVVADDKIEMKKSVCFDSKNSR